MKTKKQPAQPSNEDRSARSHDEQRDRKPGKSAHGKRGGEDDISGGSRQGNAGHQSDADGSFGNR